jgi:hypothetical protein
MAFVCSGTTIVRKQNIAVSGGQITVMVPPTGTYTIYMYLNEDGNLSLTDATIPDNNVNNVTIGSRPVNSKDDYVSVPNISAASTTLGSPITFTPLGSEVRVTTNAGVTPITGFETTLTGIQSDKAINVHVADGTYTTSSSIGIGLLLSKDNGSTGNIYAKSLTSTSIRFFSLNQTTDLPAVLTINSISGPDGINATKKNAYSSANTMTFTHTYIDKHRYNLILNLATPIYGYEGLNSRGIASGVQPDIVGIPNGLGLTPQYSGTAAWPCPMGRRQCVEWDAKALYPSNAVAPSTTSASYYNQIGQASTQPTNTANNKAQYSCKNCPTYNQVTWYLSAGVYWDDSRWYCPNGFWNAKTPTLKDVIVHTGGGWLKKYARITGHNSNTPAGVNANNGLTRKATAVNGVYEYYSKIIQSGKPGVDKLASTDQNPNDWFFLPVTGNIDNPSHAITPYGAIYWTKTCGYDNLHAFTMGLYPTNAFLIENPRVNGRALWHVE